MTQTEKAMKWLKDHYGITSKAELTVVCMTILNVSYSTLCTFMSDDIQTRVKLTGTRTFFATLAMMLANIFTVNILTQYGFSQRGYTVMVLL